MPIQMSLADALLACWIAGMWHIAIFWAGYLAGHASQPAHGEKGVRDAGN